MSLKTEMRNRPKKPEAKNNLMAIAEDETVVQFGKFGMNIAVIEFQKRAANLMWRPKKHYQMLQSIYENMSDLNKLSTTYMLAVILLAYIEKHASDPSQLKVFDADELICLKEGEIIADSGTSDGDCLRFYKNLDFILYVLRTKYSMPRYDGPTTYPEILDGMAAQINIHWIREMYLICASTQNMDLNFPTPWKY